ncbi:MAG: putative selenium-dependent hydroxylase accessory protein YqeC [Deltaproteobacteria bacterium]|nr:putative selenium-dependent hydroxylase accessory protein YqeC [Deltaproteobacteria bacterium]
MTLEEAFSLKDREVISLVGAGGKTTLMFALGNELSSRRKRILLTTTTKIWEPDPSPSFALFLSDQFAGIKEWVDKSLARYPYLVIGQKKLDNGKLQGIDPQWVEGLYSQANVSIMIVEADGAAGRSLKAPREGEPVLPANTTLLIPMMGIDVLGSPLDEEHVFRSEIAARILNMEMGSTVTEEVIVRLLKELIKDCPAKARVIPLINKVDLPGGLEKARSLARVLLGMGRPKIERVILGQAQQIPAVKEICFPLPSSP